MLLEKPEFRNLTEVEKKTFNRMVIIDNGRVLMIDPICNGYLTNSKYFKNHNSYRVEMKCSTKEMVYFIAEKYGYESISII